MQLFSWPRRACGLGLAALALLGPTSPSAFADTTINAGLSLITGSTNPHQGTTAGGTTVRTTSPESLLAIAENVGLQATVNLLGLVSMTVDGTPTLGEVYFGGIATPGADVQESLFTVRSVTPAHAAGTVPVDLVYHVVVKAQVLFVTQTVNVTVTLRLDNSFTYVAPHTVSGMNPTSGPEAGGTTVSFTGANFRSGMQVNFGGAAASNVIVQNMTAMSAVTPAGTGAVAVTLINADGESVGVPGGFTYTPAVVNPTITALIPASGSLIGGTSVAITGTGFAPGATVTIGGAPAASVVVASATQISVTTPAAPAGAGAYPVVVTNPDGGFAQFSSFTYLPQSTPTITSVTPASGPTSGGITTNIVGTGFQPGAMVTMCSVPVTPSQVTATTITLLTPACGTPGPTAVVVINPDAGQATAGAAYTYASAPLVTAVTPSTGNTFGGTHVTITGSGFQAGATVVFDASPATGVVVSSATTILATTPAHAAGSVGVKVTNPDGGTHTRAAAFVYAAISSPTITLVAPGNGLPGTLATLHGTEYQNGATVTMCGVTGASTFVDDTEVQFTVPVSCPDGPQDILLTNPDGGSAMAGGGFYVGTSTSTPVISSITPASGPDTGGTTVSIGGSGFLSGASVLFGATPGVAPLVVNSGLLVVASPAGTGVVGVTVLNTDTGTTTAPGAFTYVAQSSPTISGLNPTFGPTTGGVSVLMSGTGFQPGVTVTLGGAAAPVQQVTPVSIAFTSPSCSVGLKTVVATNPDGGSTTAVDAFECRAVSTPTVTGVSPSFGPTAGGTAVQISGSGFMPGASVTVGGGLLLATSVPSSDVLTGTTPAHAAGTVDIVVTNPDGGTTTLPGSFTFQATTCPVTGNDQDGDCLPDDWEEDYGLDPHSGACPDGAHCDPDGDGRTNIEERDDDTHPRSFYKQYFAEGVISDLFTTMLSVVAPAGGDLAHVKVRYLAQGGSASGLAPSFVTAMPAHTTSTFNPVTTLGGGSHEFATVIESDVQVAAARTVSWDATSYGSHIETGIATPSSSWYFAEGATIAGFNLFYLLSNPSLSPATATIRYLRPAPLAPIVRTHIVPANGRVTVWVNFEAVELASEEMSVHITSTQPILAERAMYKNIDGQTFSAGHAAAGVTAPRRSWFFAEGATGSFFDTFLLVANPHDQPLTIKATYLLPGGGTFDEQFALAPRSRFNIWANTRPGLQDTGFSTKIESLSELGVVAERAMWWAGGQFFEGHVDAGAGSPGTMWVMPGGEQGGPNDQETYILVANVGTAAATVQIDAIADDGTTATRTETIAAESRHNIVIADIFPTLDGKRFGVVVTSLGGNPAPIVVEGSVYGDSGNVDWASGGSAVAVRIR